MAETVFYAWQSDLPGNVTRSLIERALEEACKRLSSDLNLDVAPDRDTANVPGAPDIAATILEKIRAASAVVADVSIVTPERDAAGNRPPGRLSPNPNVLVEVGYAKGVLDPAALVLVMNTDFGPVEDLPFDLRPRRVVRLSTTGKSIKAAERELETYLFDALHAILSTRPPVSNDLDDDALIDAVERQEPDRRARARRYVDAFVKELDQNTPRFATPPLWGQRELGDPGDAYAVAQEVWSTVNSFVPGLVSVARVAQAVAIAGDTLVAGELVGLVNRVVERYQLPSRWSGNVGPAQAELDVYRAVGYELVLILTATYLREEAWDLLQSLLSVRFRLDNVESASVGIGYAAQVTETLAPVVDSTNRDRVATARRWIVSELHDKSPQLAALVSRQEAVEADVLLATNDAGVGDAHWQSRWHPYAFGLLVRDDLRFVRRAREGEYAKALARALGTGTVEGLRGRLRTSFDQLSRVELVDRRPIMVLSEIDLNAVGTE